MLLQGKSETPFKPRPEITPSYGHTEVTTRKCIFEILASTHRTDLYSTTNLKEFYQQITSLHASHQYNSRSLPRKLELQIAYYKVEQPPHQLVALLTFLVALILLFSDLRQH